jgi:oligo-1,6-glucosidase
VYAFTRRHEDVELLVLGNFSGETVPVEVPGWEEAEVVAGDARADLVLEPWEGRAYRRYCR